MAQDRVVSPFRQFASMRVGLCVPLCVMIAPACTRHPCCSNPVVALSQLYTYRDPEMAALHGGLFQSKALRTQCVQLRQSALSAASSISTPSPGAEGRVQAPFSIAQSIEPNSIPR